jgi:hypothetical protein
MAVDVLGSGNLAAHVLAAIAGGRRGCPISIHRHHARKDAVPTVGIQATGGPRRSLLPTPAPLADATLPDVIYLN